MGGGVFTYIVDLANELVNMKDEHGSFIYDMYVAYGVRKQTPQDYKRYFDKKIHLIKVESFERSINAGKDIKAFFEIKKIAKDVEPDIIHLHSSKAGALGRVAFDGYKVNGRSVPLFCTPHGYVGLLIATLLAQHHKVTAVDIIESKVEMLNNRKPPIQDEYIEKYLADDVLGIRKLNLTATLDAKTAYSTADFVVIVAPTNGYAKFSAPDS